MIIFRADGNAQIGTGHIMRCLSIAEAARDMGEECLFVNASNDMSSVIRDKGFDSIVLGSDYMNLEDEDFISVVKKYDNPIVFVDSYFVSENYLNTIKKYCESNNGKLVYIDDIKKFAYPCNILVDYNIHGDEEEYNVIYQGVDTPKYLIGTKYAPLRKEFRSLNDRKVEREAKHIFVSTGGSDPEGLSVELAKKAKKVDADFHFIVGAVNKHKSLLETHARECKNITLHENVSNISDIMRSCDVAISAAGSTLCELCATQTPTITYVLADNQIPIAEGFSNKGIMKYQGDIRKLGTDTLAGMLIDEALNLCDRYEERVSLAKKMKTVVDGQGAKRIVEEVLK